MSGRDLRPLPPGSTVGILGGGQLGRMLATAASRLGLRCAVLCPETGSPAFDVAASHMVADYLDETALGAFAARCDVVTFEFENVPARTVEMLAATVPVRPGVRSLAVCQDRLEEKRLARSLGIDVARWHAVDGPEDIEAGLAAVGTPAILKTRRLGYDGKGQALLADAGEAGKAWASVGRAPSILEAVVAFSREISVVAVRGADGAIATYDASQNEHRHGILHRSRVPAAIAPATARAARDIAYSIAEALDHVGAIGVEIFVVDGDGGERLLLNEIAPRVHNTGHWTIEACPASQFEAHIRAVAGWPLPSTARLADAEMTNLIGHDADGWAALAGEAGAALHLYGKAEARPGRKMGHVTRLRPRGAAR